MHPTKAVIVTWQGKRSEAETFDADDFKLIGPEGYRHTAAEILKDGQVVAVVAVFRSIEIAER